MPQGGRGADLREYYVQFSAKERKKATGQVSKKLSQPKLSKAAASYLNRPIIRSEMDLFKKKKNPSKQKSKIICLHWGNSTKHTKKKLYLSFSNYSKKLKRREHFQIHYMKSPSP